MPRQARVIVPGVLHHIVQRGHNRNAVVVEPKDYQYYLGNLAEWKAELGLKVFTYCLMTNHVHLLVKAGDDRSGIGQLMKRLAGRQTQIRNNVTGRTGSLWQSHCKLSPINAETCLLQHCRSVELTLERPGSQSGRKIWSRFRAVVGESVRDPLDTSPAFEAPGHDTYSRVCSYSGLVDRLVGAEKEASLTRAAAGLMQSIDGAMFAKVEQRIGFPEREAVGGDLKQWDFRLVFGFRSARCNLDLE